MLAESPKIPQLGHKARLAPTTPVTSTAISSIKMLIGRKLPTDLGSEIIVL